MIARPVARTSGSGSRRKSSAAALLLAVALLGASAPLHAQLTQSLTVVGTAGATGTGAVTGLGVSCTITGATPSGTCAPTYPTGTVVVLTASAAAGSTLVGWGSGCAAATGAACTIVMTGAQVASVHFTSTAPQSLTVTGTGGGSGTVSSAPAGIDCAVTAGSASGSCNGGYAAGTTVTLTAAASGGSSFLGWTAGCSGTGTTCIVTMDQVRTVTASFAASQSLAVTAVGTGVGTVTSLPSGISCDIAGSGASGSCQALFAYGTTLTLTAVPVPGVSTFAGWAGSCSGSGLTCVVAMTQSHNAVAGFDPVTHTVTITAGSGLGRGVVEEANPVGSPRIACLIDNGTAAGTCHADYLAGDQSLLTVRRYSLSDADVFEGWGGDCAGTGTCQLTIGSSDISTVASFTAPSVRIAGSGVGSGRVTSAGQSFIDCAISAGVATGSCFAIVHDAISTLSLTATSSSGSAFNAWSGSCVGSASCNLSMPGTYAVTADFATIPSCTIQLGFAPTSLGSAALPQLTSGSLAGSCGRDVTISAPAVPGWRFAQWSTGSVNNPAVLTVRQSATVVAHYIQQCTLAIAVLPIEGGTVTPASPQTVDCGSPVANVHATVSVGGPTSFAFNGWSDGVNTNPRVVVVTRVNHALVAHFVQQPSNVCTIRVVGDPPPGGSPAVVSGGATGPCRRSVMVAARANAGWRFDRWSDGTTEATHSRFVMGADEVLSASYVQQCTLTVVVAPSGGGTVSPATPQSGDCGLARTDVTATPDPGWDFAGWSDGEANNPRRVMVTQVAQSLVATFTRSRCRLELAASPLVGGSVSLTDGTAEGPCGRTVVVASTTSTGFRFVDWTDGDRLASRAVVVSAPAQLLGAHFAPDAAQLPPALVERLAEGFLQGTLTFTSAEAQLIDAHGNANDRVDVGDLLAIMERNPSLTFGREALLRIVASPGAVAPQRPPHSERKP